MYIYQMPSKSNVKSGEKQTVEEIFTSMTPEEHILKLPDTYIGSIVEDSNKMWVYDREKKCMVLKIIKYIPGLYKIFDEILVNARDQRIRDPTCDEIKVSIDSETGTICVWNNGDDCIPIVIHKTEKCYVPEMIFGRLRTSANYGHKGKTVGGRNGVN